MWNRTILGGAIATAAIVMSLGGPASGFPGQSGAPTTSGPAAAVQTVQYRTWGYDPYLNRGYYADGHYDEGPVEGVIGGVVGAIGDAIAGPGYYEYGPNECAARFRSYDPVSGTYLGYDGLRHPCP
jgi:hypothetical protein